MKPLGVYQRIGKFKFVKAIHTEGLSTLSIVYIFYIDNPEIRLIKGLN